ncbi:MAG TPA: SGNH hydrolase domain-containing protein [Phycicoccus elongatus]|uniref:SGNH hydrolase domain-containing protein n=1 Tax=Phycicoccus sp. TaxID=1902410 RepID=UPI0025826F6C|nr:MULTISPECIES: SGNH hydrolase domain-containing protein [Phycicoccus]HPK11967.1 SGNH hydrolase domain-containing protein [Phycicoccus elongatus]HPQ73303.1 SGNH hydrolase domain-containing protein [Phycicoccus elongatus]HRV56919.1 SGNH hydrolase domain-containing protein [Phycicoccus sp.]
MGWRTPGPACPWHSRGNPAAPRRHRGGRIRLVPNTGAGLVDLNAAICPDDTCTAVRDGVIIYRDSDHLTVRATQHLVEPLTRAIAALDSDRTH